MPCQFVLYIDASDDTMRKRLLHRGQSSGRVVSILFKQNKPSRVQSYSKLKREYLL